MSTPIGEPVTEIVKIRDTGEPKQILGQAFDPEDLIGKTYLMDPEDNGERHRAKIVKKVVEMEQDAQDGLQVLGKTKFLVNIEGSDKPDQIVDYNLVLDNINKQLDDNPDSSEIYWKFKEIVAHQGPLQSNHPDYKGSTYNVMVAWEDGSHTYEPLKLIAADDPVTCAMYAKKNNLLETPGWKRFKDIAKRHKKMLRLLNQSKLRSYRTSPLYKNGFRLPRTPEEAIEIDKENGNT